jgi:hypothetical protein
MSRGERNISDRVKYLMGHFAYRYPTESTGELKYWVEYALRDEDEFIPGPDSFRKIKKRIKDSLGAEDKPWNMGALVSQEMSSDSLADVMAIWKQCFMTGITFSIRQAKWVAVLRYVIPKDISCGPVSMLYEWAFAYAGREKAALALGLDMNTVDLDAQLMFSGEVYNALVGTRRVPGLPFPDINKRRAVRAGEPEDV